MTTTVVAGLLAVILGGWSTGGSWIAAVEGVAIAPGSEKHTAKHPESTTAQSRPSAFGIEMGTPPSGLSTFQDVFGFAQHGIYHIAVPEPHPEFEDYIAIVSSTAGVCGVSGIGRVYIGDASGVRVRSKFDEVRRELDQKYGSSQLFDTAPISGALESADEWSLGIQRDERQYVAFWLPSKTGATLPDGLLGITMSVEAVDPADPHLFLEYEFSNSCLD